MPKEYSPREHGLEGGHIWAGLFTGTSEVLDRVAAGDVPDEVRDRVEPAVIAGWGTWRSDESRDADLAEFWGGFVHGARAYIVEVRTGSARR